MILKRVMAGPGEIALNAVGPLTNADVCVGIDGERFPRLYLQRLANGA